MKSKIILSSAALFLMLVFAGCGRQMKTVYIQDAHCRTEVEVPVKADVRQILLAAELPLGEQDQLSLAETDVPDENTQIEISRWTKVTVSTEQGKKEVEMCGGTVSDALQKCGVKLGTHDLVNFSGDAFLSEISGDIVVTKRFQITLTADGKTTQFFSPKATVREILESEDCKLGDIDRVSPEADSIVTKDTEIVVQRVEKKTEKRTVSVAYSTEKEYSSSLANGKTQTKRAGVNGSKEVTYEVTYLDGVESDRTVISEKVIKQPVNAIVIYGTKKASGGAAGGKTVVSRVRVEDCDGSGHGYYIVTYSDGSVSYIDF